MILQYIDLCKGFHVIYVCLQAVLLDTLALNSARSGAKLVKYLTKHRRLHVVLATQPASKLTVSIY